MQGIRLARVGTLVQVTNALEHSGVSPETVLRRLNLPMWHHCDPESFMPYHDQYRVLARGARAVGMATFGVRVMEVTPFSRMGAFGKLVAAEPTAYRAIGAVTRLMPKLGTGRRWWLHEAQDEVWFCRAAAEVFDEGEAEAIQFALTGVIQMVRCAVPHWRPAKVWFQGRPAPELAKLEAFSEAELRPHRALSAIAIPRSALCWPTSQRRRATVAESDLPSQEPPPTDFAGSLRSVIGTLMGGGYPAVELAAKIAGLEVRTLQRRLQAEGTTYKALVERARFDAARRLLEAADVKVTEIAFELGYSDAAHFSRAFRRWAGVSPRQYRTLRTAH